ncbi:hypothetical protein F4778DRAFT_731821 [Xylariomycetidae sp. FL2044]|nr:hypothetical protein F4778DRAFT_731821 [Xylariomycetidae sp. FL2044]
MYHKIPWHMSFTCEEYDEYLKDPDNYRSKAEIRDAAVNARDFELEMLRLRYQDAEDYFKLNLQMAGEEARVIRRATEERIEQERLAREEAEKQRAALEKHRAQRRKEEELTARDLPGMARACPNCFAPIIKNGGCDHMYCTHCGSNFNWSHAASAAVRPDH